MKEIRDTKSYKPIKISSQELKKKINKLKKENPGLQITDQYLTNLEELFLLRNPKHKFDKDYQKEFKLFAKNHFGKKNPDSYGSWFYFPWSNKLVHYFAEDLHQELRTGRNKHLITDSEQKKFYNSTIGILGMSVGSHIALTIAMTGGSKHIKIADPDSISGDNLNRIRTGFENVGINKTILVSRIIYEINPYSRVEIFTDGITHKNMAKFLSGLNLLIEEMDDLYWKLKIRPEARKKSIPMLMGTDNGDGVIVDIERFDINKKYPILHGLIGKMTADHLKNMKPTDLPMFAAKIAGANFAPPRMIHSVSEVGKSLYSWPQLGTAANMCGTILGYLARKIVLKAKNIKSGRYPIDLDSIFEADYHTTKQKKERQEAIGKALEKLGIH